MTSQLDYFIARQRQAELVSRAGGPLASDRVEPGRRRHHAGTPRKLAAGPFACASDGPRCT